MTTTPFRQVRVALAYARRGHLAKAAVLVDEVLAEPAVDDRLLLAGAAVRFVVRDYQGALEVLECATARGGAVTRRAVSDRVRYASLLGWDQEVRAALESAMAVEPDEPRWHAWATRVLARGGATERALEAARRALALEPTSSRMAIEAGRLSAELGLEEGAVELIEAAARHVPAGSSSHALGMAAVLRDAGAFEQAEQRYASALQIDPSNVEIMLELAELSLWRGDARQARAWAQRVEALEPDHGGAARVDGIVAMLERDFMRAASCLDHAIARDAADARAIYWRAEAAYRMKQWDAARAWVSRATMRAEGFLFVAWVLRFLISAGDPGDAQPVCARRIEEFRDAVEAITPEARAAFDRGCEDEIVRCLEDVLARMGGNRTTCPTFVDETETLRHVGVRTGVRHASRHALQLIRVLPPRAVVAALDAVVHRYPASALPICHRGELYLWLGDLERARADLEAAIERDRFTRWAYIGLTGIDILEGDPERALRTSAHGVRTMGNTEGPAVYAYRGEALRLLGRHDEAAADLERALERTPTRISASFGLALIHAATGRRADFDRLWAHLEIAAPGLLSDASREVGANVWGDPKTAPPAGARERVLEHALKMMRGNRSTSCATYFTREGRLRFVQPFSARAKRTHDEDTRILDTAEALITGPWW